jgi:hypothetical protein
MAAANTIDFVADLAGCPQVKSHKESVARVNSDGIDADL